MYINSPSSLLHSGALVLHSLVARECLKIWHVVQNHYKTSAILALCHSQVATRSPSKVGWERGDSTLCLIGVLAFSVSRAHCLQSRLLACLDHLTCGHLRPFVHGDFVVLILIIPVQKHLFWLSAVCEGVTIPWNMLLPFNAPLRANPATLWPFPASVNIMKGC